MKTKETLAQKSPAIEKSIVPSTKIKSLRPMRSLIAKRSFKPKTTVVSFANKELLEDKRV